MTAGWEIPVPQAVTGWWPTYYANLTLPVPVVVTFGAFTRVPTEVGLSVPVTLSMEGSGISVGQFELFVPAGIGFSLPPPSTASFVVPAGVRIGAAAAERYAAMFGLAVPPRLAVAAHPGLAGSFALSVPPRTAAVARETHAPELFNFTATNMNWTLPDWCDAYDEIALGAGGGGMNGSGAYNNGNGGSAGQWQSRTIRRGAVTDAANGILARSVRQMVIMVATGPSNNVSGAATSIGPSGVAGIGVSGAGGVAGGAGSQYGRAPGNHTFNGRTYSAGTRDIPANGANYAGWTGCGDGNLGGIGTGGAGGRGALVGGDNGGPGCRGEAWVYCYQLPVPEAPLVPVLIGGGLYYQSSVYADNQPATIGWMNNGSAEGDWNGDQTGTTDAIFGEWVMRDLGRARIVDRIVLGYDYRNALPGGWGPSWTEGLSIYISAEDDVPWPTAWTHVGTTPAYAGSGSSNGLVAVPIHQPARWILLQNLKGTGNLAVLEFEAWGNPALSTDPAIPPVPAAPALPSPDVSNQPVPAGTGCWVTLIGAGGSGGAGQITTAGWGYGGGGGGGGGRIPRVFIPRASLGPTWSLTRGRGAAGQDGGDSVFTSGAVTLTAGGGKKGTDGAGGYATGGQGGYCYQAGVSTVTTWNGAPGHGYGGQGGSSASAAAGGGAGGIVQGSGQTYPGYGTAGGSSGSGADLQAGGAVDGGYPGGNQDPAIAGGAGGGGSVGVIAGGAALPGGKGGTYGGGSGGQGAGNSGTQQRTAGADGFALIEWV